MLKDTIAAIATPIGGVGGIGVIRISGPNSAGIAKKAIKFSKKGSFLSHTVRHGWVVGNKRHIDEVLVTFMAGPNSYTGENVVEVSCHGGTSSIRHVLEIILSCGARLAEKGEFTKRAFLNGKIDLTKAEAVIDLIKAKTRKASILAASHLKGSLAGKISSIRDELMALLARIEASIDFPDEIGDVDRRDMAKIIRFALKAVEKLLITSDMGKLIRDGLYIAIVGRPNVGKSSLLNAMVRDERAIVHETPGTTRDTVEESLSIKGVPARIIDTAGIRSARNAVEKAGIMRSKKAIEASDIVLIVIDSSLPLTKEDIKILCSTREHRKIIVLNKSDKCQRTSSKDVLVHAGNAKTLMVSALRGTGIEQLENAIYKLVNINKVVAENMDVMINLRHKQCLMRAKDFLSNAVCSVIKRAEADCISIDVKGAIASLGEVTGDEVSDEVIASIFDRFCVGK
jgi:tRNA modification GTPase